MERFMKWVVRTFFLVIFLAIAGFALYSWATISFNYSTGERSGYVQKISKRGWIFKTWEGELAMANLPGSMPQIFNFTVRKDDVALEIEKFMGHRVSLSYAEHIRVPHFLGDTNHFVTGVRPVDENTPLQTLPVESATPKA